MGGWCGRFGGWSIELCVGETEGVAVFRGPHLSHRGSESPAGGGRQPLPRILSGPCHERRRLRSAERRGRSSEAAPRGRDVLRRSGTCPYATWIRPRRGASWVSYFCGG